MHMYVHVHTHTHHTTTHHIHMHACMHTHILHTHTHTTHTQHTTHITHTLYKHTLRTCTHMYIHVCTSDADSEHQCDLDRNTCSIIAIHTYMYVKAEMQTHVQPFTNIDRNTDMHMVIQTEM